MSSEFFDFAEKNKFALFPMPAGQKLPHGIVDSFVHDCSRDPTQWKAWHDEHKCNFGLVAGRSGLIIADVDVAEIGREAAWQHWSEWCRSRGLPVFNPYCESARGGWHIAFALPEHVDVKTLRQVPLIGPIEGISEKSIIDLRVGNGYVVAPGSNFEGRQYRLFPDAAVHPAPDALFAACRRTQRKASAVRAGTADVAQTQKALEWMAEHDCFADYHDWLAAGMALRAHFGDEPGFPLWQITNNGTCSADAEATKWQTFSSEPSADGVDIGTLRHMANTANCPHKIGMSTASMFAGVAQLAASAGAPGMPPVSSVVSPPIAPDMPAQLSADERAKATADVLDALPDMFRNSREFTNGFVPPDYLVDTILQRGFLYSFTAQTGVGKTTVAMRLAAHVATEKPFCGHDVQRGTVLYFAGENPTDIQMRWLGLTKEMGIDPKTVDVHFTYGPNKLLPEVIARITREVARKSLTLAAIIIDTAAAHFTGQLENDNDQNGDYARQLRTLCASPGAPCVVVLCHPTKGAQTIDQMVPRGGSAFLNEVDGNIGLVRNAAGVLVASAIGKFRGPEFVPLNFSLKVVLDHPLLVDTKGRQIPTIIAEPISYDEVKRREATSEKDEIKVLRFIDKNPRASLEDIGVAVFGQRGKPKAQRIVGDLIAAKQVLYDKIAGIRTLARAAQKSLNALDSAVSANVSGAADVMPFPVPTRPQI